MPARSSSPPIRFSAVGATQLASLASRDALPAIYNLREYAAAGGLISYGTSLGAIFRRASK